MNKDLWRLFPRLIEERINGLLNHAVPNRMKSFQIYKTCQNEGLFRETFAQFNTYLRHFFTLSPTERNKGRFDSYLDRPMHKSIYEMFDLDFRSAEIEKEDVHKVANWAHNMMRINCQITGCLISSEVLDQTIDYITHPPVFEKARDIEFEDFCSAWKRVVFQLFGRRYDSEVSRVLNELHILNMEQIQHEKNLPPLPLITLTQTEIDWTLAVQKAAMERGLMPSYPLMRGPQKPALIQLERVVQLYNIMMVTTKPEIVAQQANIIATLLYRCEELLGRRAA